MKLQNSRHNDGNAVIAHTPWLGFFSTCTHKTSGPLIRRKHESVS